jgi:maltose alpha-D-glucosyltransferase / alpha-amylase
MLSPDRRPEEVVAAVGGSWFQEAIIYEAHIRAFYDQNEDGVGDIAGLIEKLDYLHELGVTALWLLPFYPSPLKDDGYDIARYRAINPAYGTMKDFRRLVRECHDRDIRLITELVVNHTSDQHPWFQRARQAKPGSAARNYYVWSDNDRGYKDARVIFVDSEKSNWTWDPVAKAYYWHRFYSHQPDLNFDNPRVLREVINAMHFWLKLGIDGLRLDAIPYLVEREGTNCENLPETHAIIRKIRAEIDARYTDRMLLAEANQWPEDVSAYFGAGDECHMCYHFPLMPRMYVAIAQEDRHPITDIMRQTPDIPENCQWATFLRNHDELTLEMVTNSERDYLWNLYASDPRMRVNVGIRRRLAPLLDNDRRKIELLNSLLFSMPGTPIIYYGDEIGMGDNVYLGDRNGVRTPMQWSSNRNGGFSTTEPERLFLPPIMDAIYGYQAVNVEAQRRSPSSLLNWMKRMIAVRKQHKAFARGSLRFLYPGNRKIFAYLREYEGETVLCVANLSRSAQAVELNLSAFKDRVPIELLGRSAFPPIGELPYLLTLLGHTFYWFVLAQEAEAPQWHEVLPDPPPEYVTLVTRDAWPGFLRGREYDELSTNIIPAFLAKQRWFGAKNDTIRMVELSSYGVLPSPMADYGLLRARVTFQSGTADQVYFLPFGLTWDENSVPGIKPGTPYLVARARKGSRMGQVFDAQLSDDFPLALVRAMEQKAEIADADGKVRFRGTDRLAGVGITTTTEIRRVGGEQSNTSFVIGDKGVLKVFRRVTAGVHPEAEVADFLTNTAQFKNTPPLLGTIERLDTDETPSTLAVLSGFVANQGSGWQFAANYLDRTFGDARVMGVEAAQLVDQDHAIFAEQIRMLGRRTAEFHQALCMPTSDAAFAAEPIAKSDVARWVQDTRGELDRALALLVKMSAASAPAETRDILAHRENLLSWVERSAAISFGAVKTRIHGDYHLGQVLVSQNDFFIIDFEGEPSKSIEERRAKLTPVRDVAGMLRSFDYAAHASLSSMAGDNQEAAHQLEPLFQSWRDRVSRAFLDGYREALGDCPTWPKDPESAARLLQLFLLQKVAYEISYEAGNRPSWIGIPVRGLHSVMTEILQLRNET